MHAPTSEFLSLSESGDEAAIVSSQQEELKEDVLHRLEKLGGSGTFTEVIGEEKSVKKIASWFYSVLLLKNQDTNTFQ